VNRAGKKPAKKAVKKKPAKKKAAAKSTTDPLLGLDPRRREYLKNRVIGLQSKKEAALNANFPPSMADNAAAKIETREFRDAFARLIQAHIPMERIAQRIDEGLDATETKFFQFNGIITDFEDLINWTERREYAKLAAEYGQYHIPRQKHEHDGEIHNDVKVTVEFLGGSDAEVPAAGS
jgi:hypothetical protein